MRKKYNKNVKNKYNNKRKQKYKKSKLKVIPLGGLGEIGKNMTMLEYEDHILIVDAGMTFPNANQMGVDIVIPDITYLEENKEKIRGIVLTHGHEDHYGGVPYILKRISTKVYSTKLTSALLEKKLEEHGINKNLLKVVNYGQKVQLGAFEVEFIRASHSIPDACSINVKTPVGNIFFTGDFKIDYTPIDGVVMDLPRIAEIGREGVLAMFAESTNVEREGYTDGQMKRQQTLKDIFRDAKARLIVATFASSLHRVQQIITASEKLGRKVALSGRSMITNVGVAMENGYLDVKKNTIIPISDINKYRPQEITIITTGSQGEPMSALSRLARGEHKQIKLKQDDTIVISANPIPGNEESIGIVINNLMEKGSKVIYSSIADVHVSGHACQEELKLIHTLVKPKFFIPMHGELRHLKKHAQLARDLGMPEENIFIGENGTIIEFTENSCKFNGKVVAGEVLVDGLGIGDVGSIVLRDRKILSEDGLIVITVTIDKESRDIVSGPEILSRGFVYVKESRDLMQDIKDEATRVIKEAGYNEITDWNIIKTNLRTNIRSLVYKSMEREPMILTVIMEADLTNGN